MIKEIEEILKKRDGFISEDDADFESRCLIETFLEKNEDVKQALLEFARAWAHEPEALGEDVRKEIEGIHDLIHPKIVTVV